MAEFGKKVGMQGEKIPLPQPESAGEDSGFDQPLEAAPPPSAPSAAPAAAGPSGRLIKAPKTAAQGVEPDGTARQSNSHSHSRKALLLPLLLALFIAGVTLCNLWRAYGPIYMADEVGFMGTAATLTGHDWSGVLQGLPYYAPVYGALLAPLMLLPVSAAALFRLLIICNTAMLVGGFFLAHGCAVRLLPRLNPALRWLACAVVILYPFNIINSQNVWCETLLVLLFWAVTYCFLRFEESPTLPRGLWAAFFAALCFAAHMRNIAVVIAAGLVLLVMLVQKKLSWRVLLGTAAGLAVFVGLGLLAKNAAMATVFAGGEYAAANDFAGQADKVAGMFAPHQIYVILMNFFARLFTMGNGTCLLLYWGMGACGAGIFSLFRKKRVDSAVRLVAGKTPEQPDPLAAYPLSKLFLLLCLLGGLGVSALSVKNPGTSLVYAMYGRYTGQLMGPFILLGIGLLQGLAVKKQRLRGVLAVVLSHLALCWVTYAYLWDNNIYETFPHINLPVISSMPLFSGVDGPAQVTFALLSVAVGVDLLFVLLTGAGGKKRLQAVCRGGAVVLLGVFFTAEGLHYVAQNQYSEENVALHESDIDLAEALTTAAAGAPVALPYEGGIFTEGYFVAARLQFVAKDARIQLLDQSRMEGENAWTAGDVLLWSTKTEYTDAVEQYLEENFYCVRQGTDAALFLRCGSDALAQYLAGEQAQIDAQSPQQIDLRTDLTLSAGCALEARQPDGSWAAVYTAPVPEEGEETEVSDSLTDREKSWNDRVTAKSANAQRRALDALTANAVYSVATQTVPEEKGAAGCYVAYGAEGDFARTGTYQATFTLQLLDAAEADPDASTLGRCEVHSGDAIWGVQELDPDAFADGQPHAVTIEFSTPQGGGPDTAQFRLYADSGVRFRLLGISYSRVSTGMQAVNAGTDDCNTVAGIAVMDPDYLPIYVLAAPGQQELLSASDLDAAVSGAKHRAEVRDITGYAGLEVSILLVPLEQQAVLLDLLDRYTIVSRLENYALLIPTVSSVETKYEDRGGHEFNREKAISIRYYADASGADPADMQATLPAGRYTMTYSLELNGGAAFFWNAGTLTIQPSEGEGVNEVLSDDIMDENSLTGEKKLVLTKPGTLTVKLTTRAECTLRAIDIFLTRTGDADDPEEDAEPSADAPAGQAGVPAA